MEPSRWHAITEIFHAALARGGAARTSYLAEACGEDGALRAEVVALLAAHQDAGAFGESAVDVIPPAAHHVPSGTMLGPYRVGALIGAGGMGEVYRATDTRLDRAVAIKVLAPYSQSSDLQARFEREARAISRLTHPHICTLYDVGHQEGCDFLVMEYLEGETLAARLARGRLPLDQAVGIAADVAAALDHAHRHGVVHRDLKPANVMLTGAGVKLLDFGIARTVVEAGPDANRGRTKTGVLVGTPRYMAPEQLEGHVADARSDIWALGCLSYELVTGRHASEGTDRLDPPALDHVVRTCLKPNPDERWQSAADVAHHLSWLRMNGGDTKATTGGAPLRHALVPLASICVILLVLLGAMLADRWRNSPRAFQPFHGSISLAGSDLALTTGGVAVSPDGQTIVFSARAGDQEARLYMRSADASDPIPVNGTEGAINPFFSSDGEWIAFIARGTLQKVPAGGGTPQPLCKASYQGNSRGQWLEDGRILMSLWPRGLFFVPGAGGEPERVLAAEGSQRFLWPSLLPDGNTVLFTVTDGEDSRVLGLSLRTGEQTTVLTGASSARYLASGHLVYESGNHLMAVPFDPSTLRVGGESRVVVPDFSLGQTIGAQYVDYDVSKTGTLVFVAPSTWRTRLAWRDRFDHTIPLAFDEREYHFPALSDDGKQFAVTIARWPSSDVWTGTVDGTEPLTRITRIPNSMFSVFTNGGRSVAFSAPELGWFSLFTAPADGSGEPAPIAAGPNNYKPTGWTRRGELLVNQQHASGDRDVALVDPSHSVVTPLLNSSANENEATLSPDGRWIAYQSDETGTWEIFVREYKASGRGRQVSAGGGMGPRWHPAGHELFYQTRTAVLALTIDQNGHPRGKPVRLFSYRKSDDHRREFDVAPDGERFLVLEPTSRRQEIMTFVNWLDELRARVPATPPAR